MSYETHPLFASLQQLLFGQGDLPTDRLMHEARAYAASAPLIAQVLVDKLDHKIQLRSQSTVGGCTDGDAVYLGPVPLPTHNQDVGRFVVFLAILIGLIHHEVGHINGTDFTAKRGRRAYLHPIEGILEDVRQERRHIDKVRPGRKWLDALQLALIITGINGAVGAEEPPIRVFTAYLLYRCRADFRNEPWYVPLASAAEARMEEVFPKGITLRLDALLQQVPDLRSTADSLALARKIGALLLSELKEAKRQQAAAQQQASSQGQDASNGGAVPTGTDTGQPDSSDGANDAASDGTDSGSSSGVPDPPDASQDSSACDAPGSDASGSPANGQSAGSASPAPDPRIQALEDLLQGKDADQAHGDLDQAARRTMADLSGAMTQSGAELMQPDLDAIQRADQATIATQLHAGLEVDLGSALGVVGKLASRLRAELQSLSSVRTGRAVTGTRIDPKALLKVPMGDARIFRRTSQGVTVDTAVVLLCDVSGSMRGSKMQVADQSLYATAVALQSCPGIAVAVATFPGNQVVLPFGARARREAERFKLQSFGCTPMEEGLLLAHRMIVSRREPRKLIFVLSDGEPDSEATAKARIAAVEMAGIELHGIGIQSDAVASLFRSWTVVQNVNELPVRLFEMLRGRLLAVA